MLYQHRDNIVSTSGQCCIDIETMLYNVVPSILIRCRTSTSYQCRKWLTDLQNYNIVVNIDTTLIQCSCATRAYIYLIVVTTIWATPIPTPSIVWLVAMTRSRLMPWLGVILGTGRLWLGSEVWRLTSEPFLTLESLTPLLVHASSTNGTNGNSE